ncbi:Bpu10I family restriction endonuclease [Pragia fontium]|uniref:Bpu10I family restriction endonuclease n=1 Tax=Pragia fontium TaxID=82985 RepID=UPI000F6D4A86|nr:Bpu10I family restriction endonuclease [Pragia fontium]VEJ53803.1 Bpu10I restriction endonuclease [Pragia fontium]
MYVHGDNLYQKENHPSKYNDSTSRAYLSEIRVAYDKWRKDNEDLKGPLLDTNVEDTSAIIDSRVKLLNEYKDFLDQQHYAEKFDSRSNLHSSVLEEFMYYLFRDLVFGISENALIGKSHSFKDIFFRAPSFKDMVDTPHVLVERKDHDFAIGASVYTTMCCKGNKVCETFDWDIPAIAIECKTYLDKTMLQDVSTAAEQIKYKNPNAVYIVVSEWLKLTDAVNLKKYKIDQIYILRKQKNTDREFRYREDYVKNPIYSDVVLHCFNYVKEFLTEDWEGGITHGLNNGFLI